MGSRLISAATELGFAFGRTTSGMCAGRCLAKGCTLCVPWRFGHFQGRWKISRHRSCGGLSRCVGRSQCAAEVRVRVRVGLGGRWLMQGGLIRQTGGLIRQTGCFQSSRIWQIQHAYLKHATTEGDITSIADNTP
jgi:hypothetical protein